MPKYQTIGEFLRSPFGRTDVTPKITEYQSKYNEYIRANKIQIVAFTEIEGSYYMHIEVPSESASNRYAYDVVLRFFTNDPEIKREASFARYYVQFFSNAPSFIYKYAVLYKRHGALIEFLYEKMNPAYADTLPEKTNASLEISFDKSIYYAARYMVDHQFRYMNKLGILLRKKKTPQAFFAGIRDFETVKLERMLISEEKRLQKEDRKFKEGKIKATKGRGRQFAIQSAIDEHNLGNNVITAGKTTRKIPGRESFTGRKGKIKAKKTTYRKI